MNLLRVFPRRTKATPRDALAFIGDPPMFVPEADAVHVSVAFTADIPEAERLARAWARIAPVSIGGPALGTRGEEFVPGRYIAGGYVITSRGCPNRCWFCSVPKREGQVVRELPITEGWNVLDDNLLACSEAHVRAVFAMLGRQRKSNGRKRLAEFTGGLEAARLQPWHVELLAKLRPAQMFFAYDTPDDHEPLVEAGKLLRAGGFAGKVAHRPHRALRCYVLIGGPKDTFAEAERRLLDTLRAGFLPMAMLWRDQSGRRDPEWARFQRTWARPAMVATRLHKEAA
jgi:hypothetical protein